MSLIKCKTRETGRRQADDCGEWTGDDWKVSLNWSNERRVEDSSTVTRTQRSPTCPRTSPASRALTQLVSLDPNLLVDLYSENFYQTRYPGLSISYPATFRHNIAALEGMSVFDTHQFQRDPQDLWLPWAVEQSSLGTQTRTSEIAQPSILCSSPIPIPIPSLL
ncbi:hypothetical protein NMY22_g18794 [Coprinellus aureogranulatus]|nr:hypothetical protein NMY22_g18794 [Coprinellus aureogranulatus]